MSEVFDDIIEEVDSPADDVLCPECDNDVFRWLDSKEARKEGFEDDILICTECGADAPKIFLIHRS